MKKIINKKLRPFYHADQGKDMTKLAIIFEILRAFVTLGKNAQGFNDPLSTGIMGLIFFVLVFSVTKYVYPIKLKDLGLKERAQWSKSEMLLMLILVPILTVVLFYITGDKVKLSLQENGFTLFMITCLCYFLWGFYMQWIYRGFLQTEFTRRYGPLTAIIISTLLFMIGSIHLFHLFDYSLFVIALLFVFELFFGFLFYKTYNLWIVATLHGIAYCFLAVLQ